MTRFVSKKCTELYDDVNGEIFIISSRIGYRKIIILPAGIMASYIKIGTSILL